MSTLLARTTRLPIGVLARFLDAVIASYWLGTIRTRSRGGSGLSARSLYWVGEAQATDSAVGCGLHGALPRPVSVPSVAQVSAAMPNAALTRVKLLIVGASASARGGVVPRGRPPESD